MTWKKYYHEKTLWMNKKENYNFIKELNSFYQFEKIFEKKKWWNTNRKNYEFYNKINYEDNRLNKNININHFKQISFKLLN